MSKSIATLETALCPVCGKESETGSILLDTKLRDRFEMRTPTAWALCPEHQKLHEEGFIALVEATGAAEPNGKLLPETAVRTGLVCHLKRDAYEAIFDVRLPPELPMVFAEPGVIQSINLRVNDAAARAENQKIIDQGKQS